LSEQRKYRSWTAQQKIEIVLAGLPGDRSVKEVCREHAISETLYYGWREKLLEGGRETLAGKEERQDGLSPCPRLLVGHRASPSRTRGRCFKSPSGDAGTCPFTLSPLARLERARSTLTSMADQDRRPARGTQAPGRGPALGQCRAWPKPAFRIEAGDLGLVIADWELNGTGPDGSPVELRGSTADVARRGPDGWKVVIDNPFGTAWTERRPAVTSEGRPPCRSPA
jgi:transposase-like protein